MIELTDTHCHIQSIGREGGEEVTSKLWSKLGSKGVGEVISEAHEVGVNRLIAVGCTLEDSKLAIELAARYPNIWASIGIHPHEAKDYATNDDKKNQFEALISQQKVIAIGECGLDYFYNHSKPDDQRKILEFQLTLASKHNLPVIFHVREAFEDFWLVLSKFKNIKGVLHSFTDSQANLDKAIERGLFIGINGIATFTKDANQTAMYKSIPISNLVLETDSPFLTPSPLRGSINEPKNVRLVAEYLAGLRSEPLKTLSSQTTVNARQLFNLDLDDL